MPRGSGLAREPWPEDEWLTLPVHEIRASSVTGDSIEFLFLERRAEEWVYRRDPRVTLAWDRLSFHSAAGFDALVPEIVLLFKAKAPKEKDQADFETLMPRMAYDRRAWLRAALEVAHPGHRWLADLE